MRLERVECPAVAVPRGGNERGLHMLSLQTSIKRAEAVNERFELRAHAVIVKRGDENEHIRAENLPTNFFNIVFLNAWAVVSAMNTADAGVNIRAGGINHRDLVTCLFHAADKLARKHIRRAVFVGTAL